MGHSKGSPSFESSASRGSLRVERLSVVVEAEKKETASSSSSSTSIDWSFSRFRVVALLDCSKVVAASVSF